MWLIFILVQPSNPENAGASARAIKTRGFQNLLFINPCDYHFVPARWLSNGSGESLENAKVFSILNEADTDFDFIIGKTVKNRSLKYDYLPLYQLSEMLSSKGSTINNVAIVFGREDSGLYNEELKLCHLGTTVPMKTTFPSLNLPQAVMLYAWGLSKVEMSPSKKSLPINDNIRSLLEKTEVILKESGFNESSAIHPRFIERISYFKEDDIHLLHSFCNKLLTQKK